jgi:hypothetical protein
MEFVERTLRNEGLGIHFTAYERDDLDGTRWIPELFVITDWKSTPEKHYSGIKWTGFGVTRETYQRLLRHESQDPRLLCELADQRRPENRRAVYRALNEIDLALYFGNGVPEFIHHAVSVFDRLDPSTIGVFARPRGSRNPRDARA